MGKHYEYEACPKCKIGCLKIVAERKGGFSGGKAVFGALVAGPVGVAVCRAIRK